MHASHRVADRSELSVHKETVQTTRRCVWFTPVVGKQWLRKKCREMLPGNGDPRVHDARREFAGSSRLSNRIRVTVPPTAKSLFTDGTMSLSVQTHRPDGFQYR